MHKSQVKHGWAGDELSLVGLSGMTCRAVFSISYWSIVTAAERRRGKGHGILAVPQYLLGSKVAKYPGQTCMHTYMYLNMETSRKLYMLKTI